MTASTPQGPIVCGIDFSSRSHVVAREAARLARALGRDLVAVAAVDPLIAHAATLGQGQDRFLADTRQDLEALVTEALDADPVRRSVHVAVGIAAEVLCDAVRAREARLLVVGTRGHGTAGRLWFGSTTAQVLAITTGPVLVMPDDAPAFPADAGVCDRIVCGVDFSAASDAAAREAAALGGHLGVTVTLVHVAGGRTVRAAWQDTYHDVARAQAADARTRLAALAAALPGAPTTEVSIGHPSEVLTAMTTGPGRTLLVIGIGGGFARRPGTTALAVLADATAPMLAVPAAG